MGGHTELIQTSNHMEIYITHYLLAEATLMFHDGAL
jgi:hypothetical protein